MATNARPRSVLCATGAGDDVLDGFGDVVGVQLLDVGVGRVGGQREGVAALLGDLLGQQVDPVLAAASTSIAGPRWRTSRSRRRPSPAPSPRRAGPPDGRRRGPVST